MLASTPVGFLRRPRPGNLVARKPKPSSRARVGWFEVADIERDRDESAHATTCTDCPAEMR
jgi:hypothetical protein